MSGLVELSRTGKYVAVLTTRWVGLSLLALVELLIVSARFDTGVLTEGRGLIAFFAARLPLVPQFAAVACAATLVFGGKELTDCLTKIKRDVRGNSVKLLFVLHAVVFALFMAVSLYYFEIDRGAHTAIFVIWSFFALATAASWLAILIDPLIWVGVAKELSGTLLIGSSVGLLALFAGQWAVKAWEMLAFATFQLVWLILTVFCVEVFEDPSVRTIGTSAFAVTIAPECSGYEGMGLAVVFISTYLWWKRKEHRFPRSLVLIPASICLMFLVNAVRIASLILIGHFGWQEIALGGFHSQAGWIGFNLVALGLVAFARTSSLFCATEFQGDANPVEAQFENRAIPMLAPFVALTLSIMVLGVVQSGFDWLYPVRFFVVAGVVVVYFRSYPKEYWNFSFHWTALVIGMVVYVIWNLLEVKDDGAATILFESTRSLSPVMFIFWLAFRILGSVVTVPLAEEFAFRGYLLPWISGRSGHWSWAALIVSSVAFGMLHPGRWLAGTVAGMLYGIAYYRRGVLMDAVIAHATTNALIALEAIVFSRWYLWG